MNYSVKRISSKIAKQYIAEHHYSHGSSNGPSPCYGLFDEKNLIGVLMFATPCSENVRSSIFGKEHKSHVIELHRLHILDVTPKNTESWFIAKCFSLLKVDRPDIWAIISFSDETEGHRGTIYQATNAFFIGRTPPTTFYRDSSGRLRHPRQNGVNITKKMARERGWTPERRLGKFRYLWILGESHKLRKQHIGMCKYNLNNSYPNGGVNGSTDS